MTIELQITLLVLFSALLHAGWNALVKVNADRVLTLGLVSLAGVVLSAAGIAAFPAPPSAAWPYLAASVALHQGYKIFLARAYGGGDLSHAYPLARGSAPLLVAALSWPLAHEALRAGQIAGVALISVGILSLALDRGLPRRGQLAPIGNALVTGVFIAAYTLMDGQGVRLSPSALGYSAQLFFWDGIAFAVGALWLRRRSLPALRLGPLLPTLLAGCLALVAYTIVIWALGQGSMAPVAALRETGVVFAAILGAWALKEPFGLKRIAASAIVCAGVITMHAG